MKAVSFMFCCCISCHYLSFVCSVVDDITVKPCSLKQVPHHRHLPSSPSRSELFLQIAHIGLAVQSVSKSHKHANPEKARDPVLGDILVVIAQIAAALQFIIEEKYLAKYRVPALLGVGLEGMWGLLLSAIALPILSVVKGSDGLAIDSLFSAFREISQSWQLQVGAECQLHFFAGVGQSLNPEPCISTSR